MPVDLSFTFWLSDGLYKLVKSPRIWNQYSRNAMRAELEKHYALRIPKHFKLGARGEYEYARRRLSTEHKKRNYWHVPGNLDLVRSGRTKAAIKQMHWITFGGGTGGPQDPGTLVGRLNMRLPYPLKAARAGGVSPEQIVSEITRFTNVEARDFAEGYRDRLVYAVSAHHGPMRFLRRTRSKVTGSIRSTAPRVVRPIAERHGPGF